MARRKKKEESASLQATVEKTSRRAEREWKMLSVGLARTLVEELQALRGWNNNMWNVAHDALRFERDFFLLGEKILMKDFAIVRATLSQNFSFYSSRFFSATAARCHCHGWRSVRAVENPRNYSPKFRISSNTSNPYPKKLVLIQCANKQRFLPICFELWAEGSPTTESTCSSGAGLCEQLFMKICKEFGSS